MTTPVLLVDLGAIYWHAWHSSNRDAAPDAPADATLARVRRWRERFERIIVAIDDPAGSWRHGLYRLYKANRAERPAGAREQLARTVDLLTSDGYCVASSIQAEADDVIATLARTFEEAGDQALIATRDKDLHALVSEHVRVLDYTDDSVRDAAWVTKRWGVPPAQLLDLLALIGDTADNVPGAPGLGELTAAKLLRAHGTIEAIFSTTETVQRVEERWNEIARGVTPTKLRALRSLTDAKPSVRFALAELELVDDTGPTDKGREVLELAATCELGGRTWTLHTPTVRKALLAHRAQLRLARELVSLRRDCVILMSLEPPAQVSQRAPEAEDSPPVLMPRAGVDQAEPPARPSVSESLPEPKTQVNKTMTTPTNNNTTRPQPQPQRPNATAPGAPPKKLVIGAGAPRRRARSNIILGRSGAGKTHFAATIENNFWIAAEDGTEAWPKERRELIGRWRFSETDDRLVIPRSYESLLDQITNFAEARRADRELPYRHFVVDSLSAIEKLVNFRVCKQEDVSGMEAKAYQAIYRQAYPLWERVQGALDLVRSSGAHVWIVAHASTVTETVAETGDTYQKTDIALQGSGSAVAELRNLWRNWADNVLVIDHETVVTKGGKGKRAVAEHRARVLYCSETAQRYAKTRCGLPPKIAATWVDLRAALDAGVPASDDRMRRELDRLIPDLTDEHAAEVRAALESGRTGAALAQLVDRVRGLVATRERDEEQPADTASAALEPHDEQPEAQHESQPEATTTTTEPSPTTQTPAMREPGMDEDEDDYR